MTLNLSNYFVIFSYYIYSLIFHMTFLELFQNVNTLFNRV